MVVFDATLLIDLLNPRIKGDRKAKLDHLVTDLGKKRVKILIPTPALAEFLARAGKAREEYYSRFRASTHFKIAPFGEKAAMECALLLDEALSAGDKRAGAKTWAKAKFDWQIVAIARTENATVIYSDDEDVGRIAKRLMIPVIKTDEIPIPDSSRQHKLELLKPTTETPGKAGGDGTA